MQGKGVSIITCTNKPVYMTNVLRNYWNQVWPEKELVIILNHDDMDVDIWRRMARNDRTISIYQRSQTESLGRCLNFAVDKTKFDYIAFFDDDDYYAPQYISNMMPAFQQTNAHIVGKKTHFIYFERFRALYLRFPNQENTYVNWVCGGKKIVKRSVFKKVMFRDISNNEDFRFCKDCREQGFKIYSTDPYDLVYIRRANTNSHTWKKPDEKVLKQCIFIAYTRNYKWYCTRRNTGEN